MQTDRYHRPNRSNERNSRYSPYRELRRESYRRDEPIDSYHQDYRSYGTYSSTSHLNYSSSSSYSNRSYHSNSSHYPSHDQHSHSEQQRSHRAEWNHYGDRRYRRDDSREENYHRDHSPRHSYNKETSSFSSSRTYGRQSQNPAPSHFDSKELGDKELYRVQAGEVFQNRYQVMRKLGDGAYSVVIECKKLDSGDLVAVKVQKKRYRESAEREIGILQKLGRHQNQQDYSCIRLLDSFHMGESACMVFPVCGPSLLEVMEVRSFKPFSVDEIREIAKNLLSALTFIHELGYIHADLKPENVLLKSVTGQGFENTVRLVDFGLADIKSGFRNSIVGTRQYTGPEIIMRYGWHEPVDMWALGCLLAELHTGKQLFATHENIEHLALMEHILESPLPTELILKTGGTKAAKYFKNEKLAWPEMSSGIKSVSKVERSLMLKDLIQPAPFLDLLKRLLCVHPDQRITAKEALRHPFITGAV